MKLTADQKNYIRSLEMKWAETVYDSGEDWDSEYLSQLEEDAWDALTEARDELGLCQQPACWTFEDTYARCFEHSEPDVQKQRLQEDNHAV